MAERVLTCVIEITDKDFISIPGLDPGKTKIPIESVTEEPDGTWTVKDVYGVTINFPYPTSRMWIVKG